MIEEVNLLNTCGCIAMTTVEVCVCVCGLIHVLLCGGLSKCKLNCGLLRVAINPSRMMVEPPGRAAATCTESPLRLLHFWGNHVLCVHMHLLIFFFFLIHSHCDDKNLKKNK